MKSTIRLKLSCVGGSFLIMTRDCHISTALIPAPCRRSTILGTWYTEIIQCKPGTVGTFTLVIPRKLESRERRGERRKDGKGEEKTGVCNFIEETYSNCTN